MPSPNEPGYTILVAEDNAQHLELIVTYLEPLKNVHVVTATNGLEAMDMVHREEPDLVLLDIMMPKMSGFEVCKRIKTDPKTRDITVIMVTALNETGALKPREAIPSKALADARAGVTRLVLDWDDDLARSIAAENLFLDRSIDRRRGDIAALRAQSGRCRPASGFAYVENALRGKWILPCERGDLLVSVTLAPTIPPSVQFLEVTPAPPPEEVGPFEDYQDAKADWQAHRTDQEGKPIMFVEFIGTISGETFDKLTFQVEGGPTITGQSAMDLWDTMGASTSVTSILVIGKDGQMIFDARRGGDVDLAAALEPL